VEGTGAGAGFAANRSVHLEQRKIEERSE